MVGDLCGEDFTDIQQGGYIPARNQLLLGKKRRFFYIKENSKMQLFKVFEIFFSAFGIDSFLLFSIGFFMREF